MITTQKTMIPETKAVAASTCRASSQSSKVTPGILRRKGDGYLITPRRRRSVPSPVRCGLRASRCQRPALVAEPRQVHHRPDLDRAGTQRDLARPLHRLLEVFALEQAEPAELLLRLRERPVGDDPLAVIPHANRGRRGAVLHGLAGDQHAPLGSLRVERAPALDPLLHLLRRRVLHGALFDDERQQVLHGFLLRNRGSCSPLYPNDERETAGSTATAGRRRALPSGLGWPGSSSGGRGRRRARPPGASGSPGRIRTHAAA